MNYPVQTRFGLEPSTPVDEFERDAPDTFRTCGACDTRVLLSTYMAEHYEHDSADDDADDGADTDGVDEDSEPAYEDQFGIPVDADENVAGRYHVEICYEARRVATVDANDKDHAIDQVETETDPVISHELHRDVSRVKQFTAEEAAEIGAIDVSERTEEHDP